MSEISKNLGNITSKITQSGAPVIEQLLDKLTGKGALIRYSFEDLNIEMPSATDPKGRTMVGGRMSIHGTITISAKVHKITSTTSSAGGITTKSSSKDYLDSGSTSETISQNIASNTTGSIGQAPNQFVNDKNNDPALRDYNSNENTPT
ncbi:MAG TPA: hypothetical protein VD815_02600 [Candidatus Saccharimonadales bacterium]|nr:hypothetical protein [Candidatus Saccharimonadales bacterium]